LKQNEFYYPDDDTVIISTDEITTIKEIDTIVNIFLIAAGKDPVKIDSFCHCEILEEKFLRSHHSLKGERLPVIIARLK